MEERVAKYDFLNRSGEAIQLDALFQRIITLGEKNWKEPNFALQMAMQGRVIMNLGILGIMTSDDKTYEKFLRTLHDADKHLIDCVMEYNPKATREKIEMAMYEAFRVGMYGDE